MNDKEKNPRGVFEKPVGSGVWWIRYCDGDGRLHREKVGRRSWAIKAYADRKADIRHARFQPEIIRKRTITFTEIAKDAFASVGEVKGTPLSIVKDWFLDRDAAKITPGEIAAKLKELAAAGLEPTTQNRYRSALMAVYKHAIKMTKKLSIPNPVLEVERQNEKESARTRFLDAEEETALRLKISQEHLPELDLALHTGLRRNELFRLRWTDVNLRMGLLTVAKSKNGKPRHIPLNSVACAALEQLAAFRDDSGYVVPGPPAPRERDWRDWFETAIEAAKIPNFHFHDLRHTFASRLVMAGVDLRTVMELMGHSDITMTMRYAHLAPAHRQEAVERLVEKSTGTRTDTGPVSVITRDHAFLN